ncbi:MAG: ATP-binding cassette domain-containing protein [Proteobacteria bacterium]|jgi:ABC-2 type transport system ATP-binding protein|nr:ATP-binding cassette domain-containing protein [Pseudomonadota bacterium]
MEIAIKTEQLSRTFKSYQKPEGLLNSIKGFWNRQYTEKVALAPTSFEIEKGKIVGLVGGNGAGKTTLLKLLSGLIHPTSGTAQVLGFKPWERKPEFLRQMSILLGQKNQLWWDIAPLDSFAMLAEIYDLDKAKAKTKVSELAELLDCSHVLQTQLRRLSLGERMKMELIGSLLHEPKILFLDEPTIGLDIVAQTVIRKFIGDYVKEKGPTVILTSHYMDDIAKLSDQLFLISQGQFVYQGTVQGFVSKSQMQQKIHFALAEKLNQDLVLKSSHPEGISLKAGQQEFIISVDQENIPQLMTQITQLSGLSQLRIEEADFEEVIHQFMEAESRLRKTRHSN